VQAASEHVAELRALRESHAAILAALEAQSARAGEARALRPPVAPAAAAEGRAARTAAVSAPSNVLSRTAEGDGDSGRRARRLRATARRFRAFQKRSRSPLRDVSAPANAAAGRGATPPEAADTQPRKGSTRKGPPTAHRLQPFSSSRVFRSATERHTAWHERAKQHGGVKIRSVSDAGSLFDASVSEPSL
jgi:hypothetical protein